MKFKTILIAALVLSTSAFGIKVINQTGLNLWAGSASLTDLSVSFPGQAVYYWMSRGWQPIPSGKVVNIEETGNRIIFGAINGNVFAPVVPQNAPGARFDEVGVNALKKTFQCSFKANSSHKDARKRLDAFAKAGCPNLALSFERDVFLNPQKNAFLITPKMGEVVETRLLKLSPYNGIRINITNKTGKHTEFRVRINTDKAGIQVFNDVHRIPVGKTMHWSGNAQFGYILDTPNPARLLIGVEAKNFQGSISNYGIDGAGNIQGIEKKYIPHRRTYENGKHIWEFWITL